MIVSFKAFARFLINYKKIKMINNSIIPIKNPWDDKFCNLVKNSNQLIEISSPFIGEYAVNKIFDFIKPQIQIKLLTNFNINNLINNSLNLGSLKKFRQNNFSIKSNSSLHSKIYIFDRKEVVISSANLTFGGLVKNHEYGFYSKNPIINQKIIDDYCEIFDHENSFEINEENLENAEKIIKSSEFNNRNLNNLIIDSDIIPHLKGWKKELFDIVNKFDSYEFSIDQVYQFRDHFRNLFPLNNHIDDKIRQTLQFLRNDGLIDFLSHGNYRKNWQTLN